MKTYKVRFTINKRAPKIHSRIVKAESASKAFAKIEKTYGAAAVVLPIKAVRTKRR